VNPLLTIRAAVEADLKAITEIYNQAILTTTATFDTEVKTPAEQKSWFEHHGAKHPLLVAEEGGQVIAWASLSQYSDRCAYAGTAEASLYVKEGFRERGVGKALTRELLEAGRKAGLHSVLVRIARENGASLHLIRLFGFDSVGVMREVGRKFGRRLDVEILQKIYPDQEEAQ
jgi:L-amino acid N-acyltransferase YncA